MSGLFSGLKKELNVAASTLQKEVNHWTTSAVHTYNEHRTSPELDLFRTGNVLQLMSRSSGRALQVVRASSGQLVVDGMGTEAPDAYHAHWTVVDEGKNIVKLHNNFNFLTVVNGSTQLQNFADNPVGAGVETKFRLSQADRFIILESVKQPGCRIGILPNGELKSALATGTEVDAHFGIRLIYRPPQNEPRSQQQQQKQQQKQQPQQQHHVYVPPGGSVTVTQTHTTQHPSGPPPPYQK